MIESIRNLARKKRMNEFLKPPESTSKPKPKGKIKQNFRKNQKNIKEVQDREQEYELTEFLRERGILNSAKNRIKLKELLTERQSFDEDFSLQDLSDEEIALLRNEAQKYELDHQINEAITAETLIDQWKAKGFSNYEVFQKLLKAHESAQVELLSEKYQQFKDFFELLQTDSLNNDKAKIIKVINESNVDLLSPKAFNKLVFSIFEDEEISEVAKLEISKNFGLKHIITGNDLRENIIKRKKQREIQEEQIGNLEESIVLLGQQTNIIRERLEQLNEEILKEEDFAKKIELEKRYDEMEELLKRLEKEAKTQREQKFNLEDSVLSNVIYVRGVEANLVDGEITLIISESKTTVSVPVHFDSKDIAKVVNAHLMYNLYQLFGLESYLFYPSDFLGDYPTQTTLDRNNSLLHKLGFSYDGSILKKSEMKELYKLLNNLMQSNSYSINLTKNENAASRLKELDILTKKGLNYRKFIEKLLWTKQFGKPSMENVA